MRSCVVYFGRFWTSINKVITILSLIANHNLKLRLDNQIIDLVNYIFADTSVFKQLIQIDAVEL